VVTKLHKLLQQDLGIATGTKTFVLVRNYECKVDRVTQICFVYVSMSSMRKCPHNSSTADRTLRTSLIY